MRWVIAMLFLAGSSFYLYERYAAVSAPPALPPPPQAMARPGEEGPPPFLTVQEIKGIRRSVSSADPGVRWAAMELLHTLRDPEAVGLIEQAVVRDPDPAVRLKAVEMLRLKGGAGEVRALIKGLQDTEPEVRIAALKALGHLGDPAAAPWVADVAVNDYDSEVKREALIALGRFQDKRRAEFAALADRLRRDYQSALKRAEKNNP